jgi:hypothetical protein
MNTTNNITVSERESSMKGGPFCGSYQWGNQNPYIEEEQTTQWPKEKVQKDKQR